MNLRSIKQMLQLMLQQEIWSLWSTHPTDQKLTSILDEGSRLVQDRQLNRAIDSFLRSNRIRSYMG
jgi:hypothetical protein